MPKITGTYTMSDWKETDLRSAPPPMKCTSVAAPGSFTGDLQGEGDTHYLLYYRDEKIGLFSGFTTFTGTLAGRTGTFVFQDDGTFDEKAATTKWTIVPGSGSGELAGITGKGGFSATSGLTITFELDYMLPE